MFDTSIDHHTFLGISRGVQQPMKLDQTNQPKPLNIMIDFLNSFDWQRVSCLKTQPFLIE